MTNASRNAMFTVTSACDAMPSQRLEYIAVEPVSPTRSVGYVRPTLSSQTLIGMDATTKHTNLEECKMTNLTIEMVEAMGYKELQGEAKSFGIKANQKGDVLRMELINKLHAQVFNGAEETTLPTDVADEFEQFANGEVEEIASEASVDVEVAEPVKPAYTKVFEFVRSNNLGVVFNQKGVQVKIGWDPSDARPYIKVGNQPRKVMMIQTAIDKFKPFSNEVHGDIARIVKALVRIKKMPAQVLAQLKQRQRDAKAATEGSRNNNNNQRQQENVSPADRKESTSGARYSGTIDASWLAEFRHEFVELHDRQPSGYEIKEAWLNRVA